MSALGNILWFFCAGFWLGASWFISGLLCCLTIVGIPIGRQCMKLATLSFFPFGRDVAYGGGAVSTLANVLWLLFFGLWLALGSLAIGIMLCCTIIGIPFGLQCFKLAKLALTPFGAEIVSV